MKVPEGYLVSFFMKSTDERLSAHVPMPTLPHEGLRMVLPGWSLDVVEVTAVQVFCFPPGSWERDTGQPLYADAVVRRARGVHTGRPEESR